MIKVTDKYGITVDEYNYVSGKIYTYKDKNGVECSVLQKPRYFNTLCGAIKDTANRCAKESLMEVDVSLLEAADIVAGVYKTFEIRMGELNHTIMGKFDEGVK